MVRVALTIDVEHPDRPTRPGCRRGHPGPARAGVGVPRSASSRVAGRWRTPTSRLRIAAAGHRHRQPRPPPRARADAHPTTGCDAEIEEATEAVRDATGVDPRPWFRCPFGAGAADAPDHGCPRGAGLRPSVPWDVDATRLGLPGTAPEVEQRVVDGVLSRAAGCHRAAALLARADAGGTAGHRAAAARRGCRARAAGCVAEPRTVSDPVGRSPRS